MDDLSKNRYYNAKGHLKYVMSAKELTELAKAVASATQNFESVVWEDEEAIQDVFKDRGITYDPKELPGLQGFPPEQP